MAQSLALFNRGAPSLHGRGRSQPDGRTTGATRGSRATQRRFRQSVPAFLRTASLGSLLTAPVVYSVVIPLALADAWITAYQWLCFPLYGIARVPRRPYFVIDRHKLAYLNAIEKLHCTYCSYANGVIAYIREIAARTELYWCPIRHERPVRAPHNRYAQFSDYGDAAGYRARWRSD